MLITAAALRPRVAGLGKDGSRDSTSNRAGRQPPLGLPLGQRTGGRCVYRALIAGSQQELGMPSVNVTERSAPLFTLSLAIDNVA